MAAGGRYIVIEGQDGTGKTTQANLLEAYLQQQGIPSIHIKEPGGSPVAEQIRSVILNATLERTPMTNTLLFTANRHELWHSIIKPALDSGTWVICTRNYWSTLAYQGYGEGMDLKIIDAITRTFTAARYMVPDAAVILAFDNIEERKKRILERGELAIADTFESKENDFQTRVQEAYRTIAHDRGIDIIDASGDINQISDAIISVLLKKDYIENS